MPSNQSPRAAAVSKPPRRQRPKLTKAQLERKRECDREAQREIRQKTKAHIAYLEGLVSSLQASHKDDGRISELVEQVEAGQKEINRLRGIIRGVGKLVGSPSHHSAQASAQPDPRVSACHRTVDQQFVETDFSLPKIEPPPTTKAASPASPLPSDLAQGKEPDPTALDPPDFWDKVMGNDSDLALDPEIAEAGNASPPPGELPIWSTDDEDLSVTRKITAIADQIIQDRSLDGRLWYLVGTLLNFVLTTPQTHQTPMEYEEDIPIRAVLHGWPAVAEEYDLDAGWLWLRHVDRAVYSSMGIPERLAAMRIIRMQYHTQARPYMSTSLAIPGFMEARPAQRFMAHDPMIEYFVWPGMREHLLFGQRKYATNKFMDNFIACSRFLWGHNPEDTFVCDQLTGRYSYSAAFVERQDDLQCWGLRSDFFSLFPELRGEIPCLDPSPTMLRLFSFPPTPKRTGRHLLEGLDGSDGDHEVESLGMFKRALEPYPGDGDDDCFSLLDDSALSVV